MNVGMLAQVCYTILYAVGMLEQHYYGYTLSERCMNVNTALLYTP
jgi:hypothetical protein